MILLLISLLVASHVSMGSTSTHFTIPENLAQQQYNKIELGKILFFDPILSGSNIISCATCHNPSLGWSDGLPRSVGAGHQILSRKTPTVLNMKFNRSFFWDGRAQTLEEQALGPIQSTEEMNQNLSVLMEELQDIDGYQYFFNKVFPQRGISPKTLAEAIAAFERTLVVKNSQFQKWLDGDHQALTDSARRGFFLFVSAKTHCTHCHFGDNLSDGWFHDIGVNSRDIGRGKFEPNKPFMQHAFKTPTLWNIALRAPYMHNGSEKSLEDVIDFYTEAGRVKRSSKNRIIKPLHLNDQEKTDLVSYLKSLTGEPIPIILPRLPR